MSPAAHALDRLLHDLRLAHEAVTADLAELEAEGTYAVIAGGTLITGTTADRAQPALAQVDDVRLGLDLLDGLLTSVSDLRGGPGHDPRAAELFAHLNSPAIVLPGPSTCAVTPQDLLAALPTGLAPMRAIIHEVDTTWRELLPRLDRAAADAERLPVPPSVHSAVAELAERVIHDPLGAAVELAEVEASLAAAAAIEAEVLRLRSELVLASETADDLEILIGEGRAALARSRTEIRDPTGLLDPVDPAVITGDRGLGPWLARLDRLVGDAEIDLAEKGLASWRALADKMLATAHEVATVNARPSQRRRELKDLLRAARVKAGASGRAEDPRMTELATLADAALTVPCTLAAAESRVADYVDELRQTPTPAQATREEPSP